MQSNNDSGSYGAGQHPSFSWDPAVRAKPPIVREPASFAVAMDNPRYPRSARWCQEWIFHNTMGPINLWCTENLAGRMDLRSGMRVLDLGCGAASSSIFLASEFGVEVWAADLWIDPDDNQKRIEEAGLTSLIHPLRAEAHNLQFEHGFFDAIVSIDAYHYFGTDVRYLSYLSQFVRPGGSIGTIVPANAVDPDEPGAVQPDPGLMNQIGADWFTFRSAAWWKRHWRRTPYVEIEIVEMVEGGPDDWQRWIDAELAAFGPHPNVDLNAAMLASQAGSTTGFCVAVATRNEMPVQRLGMEE